MEQNFYSLPIIFFILFKNFDYDEYYTTRDPDLLASNFMSNLAILSNSWSHLLGRPTICMQVTHSLLGKFGYKKQNQPQNLFLKSTRN